MEFLPDFEPGSLYLHFLISVGMCSVNVMESTKSLRPFFPAGELSRRVGDSSQSDSGAYQMMRAVTDTVIGPVLRALLDSPEFTWTVPQMARIADISKSSFSDRFRRLVGIPPLQYLTEIRMAKSRRLLAESNVEISEIALLVGYESASSFSNVFKRWHGNSPMEYRRGSRCRTEGTDGHSLTT